MEKLEVIAKIINCMDFLIMGLSDKTLTLRCAIGNVVEYYIIKEDGREFQNFIIKTNMDILGKYVYCTPEKRPETKKRYINEVYNLLLTTGEHAQSKYLVFLNLVYDKLSNACNLLKYAKMAY